MPEMMHGILLALGLLAEPRNEFWNRLQTLCGKAYEGALTEGQAVDSVFRRSRLVIHIRSCSSTEIRIALHSDADRSRTWVLTRTDAGLRLKHDHRHEDGTPDRVTEYGGDTHGSGSPARQDFHADTYTAALVPTAATNVWTMEIEPGKRFAYSLRREGRHVRLEFDLSRPVPAPPPPWGTRDPEPASYLVEVLRIAVSAPANASQPSRCSASCFFPAAVSE